MSLEDLTSNARPIEDVFLNVHMKLFRDLMEDDTDGELNVTKTFALSLTNDAGRDARRREELALDAERAAALKAFEALKKAVSTKESEVRKLKARLTTRDAAAKVRSRAASSTTRVTL